MNSWVEVSSGKCKKERQNIAVPGRYQYQTAHVGQNWDDTTLNSLPTEELTKSHSSMDKGQEKKSTILSHKKIIATQFFF